VRSPLNDGTPQMRYTFPLGACTLIDLIAVGSVLPRTAVPDP
jgi:hypothetical protein